MSQSLNSNSNKEDLIYLVLTERPKRNKKAKLLSIYYGVSYFGCLLKGNEVVFKKQNKILREIKI